LSGDDGRMGLPDADNEADEAASTNLARNTAVMALGTLLSRLTGFGRLAAMTAAFGIVEGPLADAYNKANVAPNIVYELVLGGVLSSVLVPVLVETLARDREEHRHVTNTIASLAGLVLVVITTLGIVAAPWLATLFTLGAEGSAAEVAHLRWVVTLFLRLFLPQVLFYGLTTVWTAYLNAHRHFAAPMFAPVLNNLVVIGVLLWFGRIVDFQAVADLGGLSTAQLWLLGLGTTAGIAAMTVPLWPVSRQHGWSFRPTFDWRHPVVRRVGRLGVWAGLYVLINQVGYVVVIVLTSAIPGDGAFAAYAGAFVFFQLPHGIYAVSVMTALVPGLAHAASTKQFDAFRTQLAVGIRATALFIVPAAVGLAVLAQPVVKLLLERGAFTAASTSLVSGVLVAFAIGLPSFSLFQLFLRAHYALQDTRSPVLVNVAAVSLNIAVDIALFLVLPDQWKVVGLAVGHAAAYTLGASIFALRLRRLLNGLGGRDTSSALGRIGLAAVGMGGLAWLTARAMDQWFGTVNALQQAAQVGAAVALGGVSYVVIARILRISELDLIKSLVRRRVSAD